MPTLIRSLVVLGLGLSCAAQATAFEIFARGSISKNSINENSYVVSLNAATGVAFTLLPQIRLEARYTNNTSLQNYMALQSGAIHDLRNQTSIYSVGVDLDIMGPQSTFRPFIYVGVGYVRTERNYYFLETGETEYLFFTEPVQTGISINAGAGFNLKISDVIALELEAFAYAIDAHTNHPLINMLGSAGIRLYF